MMRAERKDGVDVGDVSAGENEVSKPQVVD